MMPETGSSLAFGNFCPIFLVLSARQNNQVINPGADRSHISSTTNHQSTHVGAPAVSQHRGYSTYIASNRFSSSFLWEIIAIPKRPWPRSQNNYLLRPAMRPPYIF